MGWLNKLANEAKYAHDINYLGPAYVQAEQAAKELESEGKTEEAKEIRAAILDNTINAAMTAGLAKGVLGAGKALLRKQLMPTIRLGAGMAGGIGGMYVGDKLVHTLSDGKYDTWGDMIQDKTKGIVTPTLAYLSDPLVILGGFAGGWGANKAYTGTKRGKIDVLSGALDGMIDNAKLDPSFIDQAAFLGKFGWGPKQTVSYRHGSDKPDLKVFEPKFDRWDVKHGASPYQYFVTDQTTPVNRNNMMDLRPMQYTGELVFEKPMVQVGEIRVKGPDGRTIKNTSRNQLIARARQQGADGYLMQGIEDNKVPNQNVVVRFIGAEGEAVQGKPATVEWYGPTMGKTTAAKTNPNLVDIDPLLKPIRLKHAERLGLKISDPKVSADPTYKQEVADFVLEWRANPENQGKTLVASTKHLLAPEYNIQFANEPAIPEFEVFADRNKTRGFKETDEQLRAWYNSILEQGRDLVTDNRFVSDIKSGTRAAKISEAERLGIPKGTKYYTKEENIAFRNQINDFAKKYGYEPIGDEVTDPEVLERYARSLIKRHNTFYRGVELNPQEPNLSLEDMATHAPGGGAGELYITPYQSVAAMYGEPVEILKPYKLGADRTRWFNEGDFQIYTAGGRRDMHLWENKKGIAAPWLTSETFEGKSDWIYKPHVETELTGRNQQFIPISVQYRNIHPHLQPLDRVGSLAVPTTAFYKSGGKLNYLNLMK